MRIGLSLPASYLCGAVGSAAGRLLRRSLGAPTEALVALKDHGLASIELRGIAGDIDVEMPLRAARRVWDAGMTITVHDVLPPEVGDGTPADGLPAVNALARALDGHQDELMVVVHAYRFDEPDPGRSHRDTAAALKSIRAKADEHDLPVRLAVEMNRGAADVDAGTTYESLVGLCREVNHPGVGICWDFGHAEANVRRHGLAPAAPAAFAALVIHTHVHGLNAAGKTHHALGPGRLPLGRYLRPLRAAGYDGICNLELNADLVAAEGDIRAQILASIAHLSEALHRS